MQTTTINLTVASIAAVTSFFTGVGGVEVADRLLSQPKPFGLHLVNLEYQSGFVKQNIQPINSEAVRAEWAAKFTRSGRVLCAGGGASNYDGTVHEFTPSEWTGQDCPVLQAGDIGSASWTYKDVNGNLITISGKVEVR